MTDTTTGEGTTTVPSPEGDRLTKALEAVFVASVDAPPDDRITFIVHKIAQYLGEERCDELVDELLARVDHGFDETDTVGWGR